ncbi:MAG: hypothetical protein WAJ96_12655 [Candidatus Acidiferrum sp.]
MMKKYGKFYSDYRDAEGHRHRKAFDTKKQAAQFSEQQRSGTAAAKKVLPRRRSPRSQRSTSGGARTRTRSRS